MFAKTRSPSEHKMGSYIGYILWPFKGLRLVEGSLGVDVEICCLQIGGSFWWVSLSIPTNYPRGSKYPIFKASGPKYH